MITAQDFASLARAIACQQPPVPYAFGGRTLAGMDSVGFIRYCLQKFGVKTSIKGTNTYYRSGIAEELRIPLREAWNQGLVIPGVILFHVSNDLKGMPSRFKKDGLGNADYCAVCIEPGVYAYPSEKLRGMIVREIDIKNIHLNMMVYDKYITYV